MAKVGRPKYEDGPYMENQIEQLIYHHTDFKNESDLQSHIIDNIDVILGEQAYSVEKEIIYPPNRPRQRSKFRMDIVAVTEKSHYLIECKAPSSNAVTSLVSGIAQLHLYGIVYQHVTGIKPVLVLACDKINEYLTHYMREYAKDVILLVVGKDYHLRMQHNGG